MYRILYIFIFFLVGNKISAQTKDELIYHWAPIHIQNVCKKGKNSLKGKSDEITRFDFDGDWNAINNWENLEVYDIAPVVYFDLKETERDYFIMFAFFHPRDWTRFRFFGLGQHENDLEGVFMWVSKNDTLKYGDLKAVFTIFHNDILTYLPENSLLKTQRTITPRKVSVSYQDSRIVTVQQAKGHGVKLFGDLKVRKGKILYTPINQEVSISNIYGATIKTYELIDIMSEGELWSQKDNLLFFEKDQTIKGDNGKGANPPWLWKDWNDKKKLQKGAIFMKPQEFIEKYFEYKL